MPNRKPSKFSPANSFILPGTFWTPRLIEMNEVNYNLLRPKVLGELIFACRFVSEDHDFGGAQCVLEIGGEHGTNMRDDFFDVLAISAGDASHGDVLVPDLDFEALAHEAFDQLHLRTLAQIVGASFETQAELRNLLLPRAQHHLHGAIDVLGVARHEGFEQGQLEIEFLGFVGDGAQIFRKARPTKGETRGKIGGGNIQLGVGSKNFGDRLRVDAEMLAHGSHFVGEADFQRVIAVGKVLDHFGDRDGRLVESAGSVLVEFAQRREVVGVAGSEDGVGRVEEVGDGAAFAHELRVIADGEILAALLAAFFFQDGEHDGLGGSRQHRAAHNNNMRRFLLPDGAADFPGNALDAAEVELAIFQAGRSDANE